MGSLRNPGTLLGALFFGSKGASLRTFALFIDAGYFFAAAGELLCGRPLPRNDLKCDFGSVVVDLVGWARDHLEDDRLRLLRCYWYDGARDGVPSPHHLEVARLPDVKLRLGRKTASGQKGVDGLIILDLLTLARDGGLDTAFVVSGDEDLREACLAAQQMGVRVVLLGIRPRLQDHNQADTLIREADEHHVLPDESWTRHLSRIPAPPVPFISSHGEPLSSTDPLHAAVEAFVGTVVDQLTTDKLLTMMDGRPALPSYIDAQMLRTVSDHCGNPDLPDATKRQLRATFWEVLDRSAGTR